MSLFCLQISCGDIFKGAPSADAVVSPANSFGFMDGGIDMVREFALFILIDSEIITQQGPAYKNLGLVHTNDGIGSGVGIRSARRVTIQCKSKIGIGSGVASLMESESEGSEEFLFLLITLPSLPIQ